MQLWTHKKNVYTQCSTEQDIPYPLSYTLCPKSFIIEQEAQFVPRWEEQTWEHHTHNSMNKPHTEALASMLIAG